LASNLKEECNANEIHKIARNRNNKRAKDKANRIEIKTSIISSSVMNRYFET